MDYTNQRREKLAAKLAEEDIDAFLITNPVNVTWLTGFSGESSPLLITREHTLLISDSRFTVQIAEECPELECLIRGTTQTPYEVLIQGIEQIGAKNIGFESHYLTVAGYENLRENLPTVQWKGVKECVETLRMIKDDDELAQIREAIAIAERCFSVMCHLMSPEDSELELVNALDGYVRKAGGREMAFSTIIAVGERAALPHAPPTQKKVNESELLLVDWGVSGKFYKSDLTRVLDVRRTGNSPSEKLQEVHRIVQQAQEAAIAAVRPGAIAKDIDTAARKVIADAGYGDYFGHGLGHGFGLDIHELPGIRPRSETVIEEGMVFTIEPGIYLPGWGGVRLEDDVLVTSEGCEVLTGVRKDLMPIFV